MLHTFSIALLPIFMIMAAVTDVASMKIPNWLTALTALSFFPMAYLVGMPLQEFAWHLAGGAILFVLGFILFSVGLFGGGDAKLMAAAGLWFGTSQSLQFLVMTVYFGGLLCIAFMVWSLMVYTFDIHGRQTERKASWLKEMMRLNVPYGLALAAGAIVAFPATRWVDTI